MFTYNQLAPVVFGNGAVGVVGEKTKELGCKKVICVYDAGVKAAGAMDKVIPSLEAAGIEYVLFGDIQSDPACEIVDAAGALACAEKVDGVIGIGGGSSMDAAKAVALLLDNPAPIAQYLTLPPTEMKSSVPIVLIPTTSGTGSEVTHCGVYSDTVRNLKLSIFVHGHMAIVDPELTLTVPPYVTAYTGIDAFTHAVESITALKWNPQAQLLASAAISKICKYLPIAVKDGGNLEARYELSLASNWAGIAFTQTDVHFGHGLADGISCRFHTPHGTNCGWACPELMKFIAPNAADQVKMVGEAMGLSFCGCESAEEIGEKVAEAIRNLMRTIGIESPASRGYTREEMLECTEVGFASGLRFNCPTLVTEENTRELYGKIWDNYQ